MNFKIKLTLMWLISVNLIVGNSNTETFEQNERNEKSLNFNSFFDKNNVFRNILRDNLSRLRDNLSKISINYRNFTLLKYYDYIIVGAGPAGIVLANRLTENPNVNVLLLEVGRPELSFIIDVPMSSPNLQSTSYNWGYETEPQEKACLSMNGNRCQWPHGRGLGGSTLINYMIYTRGNRRDFDSWSKAGNRGWSYDEILPYYLKSENVHLKNFSNNGYHGHDGPLNVEDIPFRTPIADAFVKSAQEYGYNYVDYNSKEQIGVSYVQSTSKNGMRYTAAESFLNDVRNRPNLHISTKSWVTKIIINKASDKNLRAKGVKFVKGKREFIVKVKREVILSAGAFESPKLLMLSGIGPAKHLNELNIDLVKDLPVGETLYEHIGVFGPMYIGNNISDGLINSNNVINTNAVIQYYSGKGPLTTNGIESILYMKTNVSDEIDDGLPDIELMQAMATVSFDTAPGTRTGLGLSDNTYNSVFKPIENNRTFLFLPMLLHPKSKGFLKLKTKNPFHRPLFFANFFDNEHDIATLISGIRVAMEIAKQKSFEDLQLKVYEAVIPGCENYVFNTDEYWRCYIMHLSATLHHQVGTCKMGMITDKSSVVNSDLLVHGFENLRVADISIIPTPPSGHTAAYSFMIGEKTADMIKMKWNENDKNYGNLVRRQLRQKRSKVKYDWQFDEDFDNSHTKNLKINTVNENIKTITERKKNHTEKIKLTTSTTELLNIEVSTLSPLENIRNILRPHDDEFKRNLTIINNESLNVSLPFIKTTTDYQEILKENKTHHFEVMSEKLPSANEDFIRKFTLKNGTKYGSSRAKPRDITRELSKMNSTEYTSDLDL